VWFGNVPTLRGLADRVSVKAITTVQRSLQKLGQRGAIRRVPGISGGPPPQRIFAHIWLVEPLSHNARFVTYAASAYSLSATCESDRISDRAKNGHADGTPNSTTSSSWDSRLIKI
jgi:hypothetical protein